MIFSELSEIVFTGICVMAGNFDRTQALFTAWKESRSLKIDSDGLPIVGYYDGAVIVPAQFSVHVGNQEFHTDSLHEAEKWLWNNWVRHE